MRRPWLTVWLSVLIATAFAGGLAALSIYWKGVYGYALFFGIPLCFGFIVTALLRLAGPQTVLRCVSVPLIAMIVLSLGMLTLGLEGIICIVMAIPLVLPTLTFGSLIGYWLLHERDLDPSRAATTAMFVMILSVVCEPYLHRDLAPRMVETSISTRASASSVWNAVVTLDAVPDSGDWMFRAGVARPERTRIIKGAPGGYRICRLSTGNLIEQIDTFKAEEMLSWETRTTPPPIKETNPFHKNVDPPHLHGYYETPRGEIAIDVERSGSTRITRRTWYTQRLYPQVYWNFWAEVAIGRIHRIVLNHIAQTAQANRA
jgi:hypothetical protein